MPDKFERMHNSAQDAGLVQVREGVRGHNAAQVDRTVWVASTSAEGLFYYIINQSESSSLPRTLKTANRLNTYMLYRTRNQLKIHDQ